MNFYDLYQKIKPEEFQTAVRPQPEEDEDENASSVPEFLDYAKQLTKSKINGTADNNWEGIPLTPDDMAQGVRE